MCLITYQYLRNYCHIAEINFMQLSMFEQILSYTTVVYCLNYGTPVSQ